MADLLGIHPNSAALFYHKIHLVIEHNLNVEAHTLFDGKVELDESYFGGVCKGNPSPKLLGERGAGGKTYFFWAFKT